MTQIALQLDPKDINYFNRIMEGYEYLGMVSTLDPKAGLVAVRTTADCAREVCEILAQLDLPFRYADESAGHPAR